MIDENFIKFVNFLDIFEQKIKNDFQNIYKLRLKLKFYEMMSNDNRIYSIECSYSAYEPKQLNKINFIDKNIFITNLNEGYLLFIKEIKEQKSESIKYEANFNLKNSKINVAKLNLIEAFAKNQINNGIIKELNKNYYSSIVNNSINIYSANLVNIIKINITTDSIFNFYSKKNKDENEYIELIISGKEGLYLINIDLSKKHYEIKGSYETSNITVLGYIEMEKNNYIL